MRGLIELLNAAVEQAIFDAGRFGTFAASGLWELYRQDPVLLTSATPQLPDILESEIAASLRSILSKHIDGDRVGMGLVFFLMGFGSWPTPLERFASDLVRASALLGSERVVKLLVDWENGNPIPFKSHVVLDGISVEQPLGTQDGIRVIGLPQSSAGLEVELPDYVRSDMGLMTYAGKAKLIIASTARSAIFREEKPTIDEYDVDVPSGPLIFSLDSLDQFCKSLAFACNSHISWEIAWFEGPELRAFGVRESGLVFREPTRFPQRRVPLEQQALSQALAQFERWRDTGNTDAQLNLASDRWMASKGKRSVPDQFIDLRIALEALYLAGGQRTELRFRLSQYAAWHLGIDFQDRRRIFDCLRRFYDHSSAAIHASTKHYTNDDMELELLANAQDLCREAILKILEDGIPKFDDLVLGKTT